jgi:hypothetical protein
MVPVASVSQLHRRARKGLVLHLAGRCDAAIALVLYHDQAWSEGRARHVRVVHRLPRSFLWEGYRLLRGLGVRVLRRVGRTGSIKGSWAYASGCRYLPCV